MYRQKKERAVMLIIAVSVLSCGMFFSKGPIIYPDSSEYIAACKYLPMFYPMFLHIFHSIFGESYLYYVVVFQTVLAVWASVWLGEIISKLFGVKRVLFRYVILFILLGTFFVENMRLTDGIETCNLWILTEGLSYPLFYFFVIASINLFRKHNISSFLWCLGLAAVLTLCRKQMLACFAMIVIYGLYFLIVRIVNVKMVIICGILFISILGGTIGIQDRYQSQGSMKQPFYLVANFSHLFFYAERGDAQFIDDENERQLFLEIYEEVREKKLHCDDAEKSIMGKGNAYLCNFNPIIDIACSHIYEYVKQFDKSNEDEDAMVYDILECYIDALQNHKAERTISVIKQIPFVFAVAVAVYPESFAQNRLMGSFFLIYSVAVVCFYIMLILYNLFKYKHMTKEVTFASMILIYLIGSGLATTYMIRSMGRYMFYCCGLFYVAIIMLIRKNLSNKYS